MNEIQKKIIQIGLENANSTREFRMTEKFLENCEEMGRLKSKLTFAQIFDVNEEMFRVSGGKIGSLNRMAEKSRTGK